MPDCIAFDTPPFPADTDGELLFSLAGLLDESTLLADPAVSLSATASLCPLPVAVESFVVVYTCSSSSALTAVCSLPSPAASLVYVITVV